MSKLRLKVPRKNLVLIGHMGSGKSTIGRDLSKKLKIRFFDVDRQIEKEAKKKIIKIFAEDGEKVFRELEKKVTINLLDNSNTIIALGGGGFENNNVRKLILNNCVSIWLKCDLNILEKRCILSKKRPLLRTKDIKKELIKFDKIRKSNYSKAKITIDVSEKTKYQIIKEILNNL